MRERRLLYGVLPVLVLQLSWNCFAQTVPPQNVSPGAVIEGIQENTNVQTKGKLETKQPQAPDIRREPSTDEKSASIETRINTKEIMVEGVTLLDPHQVERIVSPYKNRENRFADLQELTLKLTSLYQSEGYITSRVFIPPQKIENGVVHLKASEGYVGDLAIEEGKYFKSRSVRHRVEQEKGEPFNVNELSRDLREINENPDMKAQATLKPGKEPHESDIQLKITDKLPVHLTPFVDNTGRDLIGNERFGLLATHNNLLGFGDRIQNSISFTSRSFGLVDHYEVPINAHGTKVGLDFAHSRISLGKQFDALDLKGRATVISPYISQSLINRERYSITSDLAFDFKDLDTNLLGADLFRDRLRILRTGINFEEFDRRGRTFMRHEMGIGMDILGASIGTDVLASRAGAGSQFFRYTGSLSRVQKLPWSSYGIFRAIYQLSPNRLVSSEQLQMGGAFTVRGYQEGQVIGDQGVVLSGEWRLPFFLFPRHWMIPNTNYALRDNVQLVSFLDFGTSSTHDPAAGVNGSQTIIGTGLGLRARLTRFLVGRLDVGFPLVHMSGINQSARIHFGVQSELF